MQTDSLRGIAWCDNGTSHPVQLNAGLGAKPNRREPGMRHLHEPITVGSTGSDPNSLVSKLRIAKEVLSEQFNWPINSITDDKVLEINPYELSMGRPIVQHFSNKGYVITDGPLGFINSSRTVQDLAGSIRYRGPRELTLPPAGSDAQ